MTVHVPRGNLTLAGGSDRLRGSWLIAGYTAWAILAFVCAGLFLIAIPAGYDRLTHLSPELQDALAHGRVSVNAYAGICLACDALYVSVSLLVGGLILGRKSADRMALFVAIFLAAFAGATSPTIDALASGHAQIDVLTTWLGALGYIGLNGLFYLFPDGRFVPRWTWIMFAIAIVGQVPFSMPDASPFNPNSWPPILALPLLLGIFGIGLFAQVYRYRYVSSAEQRQQTKWVVYGAIVAITIMFVARTADMGHAGTEHLDPALALAGGPLLDLGFVLIPVTIGLSVLRYRLWDIDLIISRTLIYGGLSAGVVALYVLFVGYLSEVLHVESSLGVSLLATGIVAIAFQPLRQYLQTSVNRLMYGARNEPYTVLSELGKRLEGTLAPDTALITIVETVARSLRLPFAAIELAHGDESHTAATFGSPVDHTLVLPLVYGTESVGTLTLGARSGERDFSSTDRRLLNDLARQAGVAAYAACITADLRISRERLVTAREEERRRIRRDLHDGLGPALGAFSLKLGAARNALAADNRVVVETMLADLIGDVQAAVSDIRRLVHDLRPPALDELGLVGAIETHVRQYSYRGEAGPNIRVESTGDLGPLPAAVEVAAYRITQEALANVVRHSGASSCLIQLTRDGQVLQLQVEDNGVGLPAARPSGVGLISMHERAEELGGSCTIEPGPGRGTQVKALLPVRRETGP